MILLERIDSAPLFNESFSTEFNQWLANLVDTLNEVINALTEFFLAFGAFRYTQAEIIDRFNSGAIENGHILYDSDNNVYVGMQGGALVSFNTSPYP